LSESLGDSGEILGVGKTVRTGPSFGFDPAAENREGLSRVGHRGIERAGRLGTKI